MRRRGLGNFGHPRALARPLSSQSFENAVSPILGSATLLICCGAHLLTETAVGEQERLRLIVRTGLA